MMNNYNSLSLGIYSYLKKWNSGSVGSPPTETVHEKQKTMSFGVVRLMLFALVFLGLFSSGANAQTTLIDPAAEGGFNIGTTFASNGWTVSNYASSVNQWVLGNAVTTAPFAGRSAYISLDGGVTNSYSTSASTRVYFYRDVAIPSGSIFIPLSFTWQSVGESSWDHLQVYVAPTSVVPTGNIHPGSGTAGPIPADLTGATQIGFYQSQATPQTGTAVVPLSWAGQTVRLIFMWKSDTSVGTQPPLAVDNILLQSYTTAPTNTATAIGGLWSSPQTWLSGTVPNFGDVVIPAGSTVTVDQTLTNFNNIDVAGTLQWGSASFAATLTGNLTIASTGRFLPHTTGGTGQAITIAGNLTNNGYANLALASTAITFNGSGSTLSGTGIFQGNGTSGIIRALLFSNTGSNTISTSQNLITGVGAVTAGSLNTNGKLTIDNTAQIYGLPLNTQVSNLAVTNMGTTAYSVAPVVFGASVTQWDAITGVAGTLYVSGSNVYRCTAAASIGAAAPTHTSGVTDNLLWIGTTGTLGNPFSFAAVTVGTQVFYGNNLYVCTVAGSGDFTAPPVHTSGTATSGTATFLYVGSPATASVNFEASNGTVRSLNLTSAGSGLSSAPSIAFSVGVLAGTGAGAAASAAYIQSVAGPTNSLMQKSGVATISGGLTINSDQGTVIATSNPQASSGVGAIFATNGGVAYTSAPTVGFSGPTALNLVVDPGSGYTTLPTVVVTGGTIATGTGLVAADFTVVVNNGTVQAVYLTGTSSTYSVPPTLSLSGGNATIAWPAGCWPAATATIGSNGQVTNFTVTSSGFGYVAAPSVGLLGGTPVTAASGVSARVGLYNLTLNFFTPAATAVVSPDDAVIPDTRKLNNLTLAGNGNGLNLTNDLTLYGTAPFTLTASLSLPGNILDLGGFNLNFTWNGYAGTTASFSATSNSYIRNGSMSVTGRGGASTFNFPFAGGGTFTAGLSWFAGSTPTAITTGSSVTRVTVSDTAAPTNASVGTAIAVGNRSYRVQFGPIGATGFTSSPVTGTNPTVTLGFNSLDGLTGTQNNLFLAESTNLTGPWTNRSTAFGASGALPATGIKTTATAVPGPIVPTSNSYYAWAASAPVITSFAPLTLCASSGTFTITGSGFTGVTDVTIGGTAVSSFVIVSDTQITGVAGVGTSGVVALTKLGFTVSGVEAITVNPAPGAVSASPASATVTVGTTVNVTASGSETTFNWYNTAVGGTPIFTGATYSAEYCVSTNLYVAQSNGSCDGPRLLVPITVTPITISSTTPTFCGVGGNTTLSTPSLVGATYAWTSLTPSATINSGAGTNSIDVTVTETSDFQLVVTGPGACSTTVYYSVGVYALPTATVTTSASGVCPGTTATINSGLVAGNFISNSITFAPQTPPVSAVALVNAGVVSSPLTSGSLDDGGWGAIPIGFNFDFFGTQYSTINVGTNGTVQFGTYNAGGLGDFTFTTLPSTTEPFNIVAVLAMDNNLNGAAGGAIRYWTQGYAPNRKFVVMYDNVQEFGDATKFSTSQVIFYETTGLIEVHVTSSTNVDRVKLVGVNNGNGTVGVLAYNSGTVVSTNPQNPIANPFAYRFTPPYNYTTTWTADEGEGPTVIASGTNVFSQTVAPTTTTTYTISYTNQTTGCTNALNSAQVEMVILGNEAPTGVTALASSTLVCPGFNTILSTDYTGSPDGLTYQWQEDTGAGFVDIVGATAATYTAFPTVATTYRLRIRSCDNVAGESYSSTVSVTITDVTITSSTGATRCGTGPVSISAAGTGTQVSWYANPSGGTALFTGSPYNIASIAATTTFYVASEVAAPSFCSGVRVPVTVTVTPAPALTFTSASSTICSGSSTPLITLSSNPADFDSYTWSPTTGVTGDQNAGWIITPTASTTYTLSVSNAGNCLNSATYTVTVNPNAPTPEVTPASPTLACGSTTPVLLSVGASYTNPTPVGPFCLNNANGQWPTAAAGITPVCDGTTVTTMGISFTAEHSLINVTPNTLYTFGSSGAGDIVAITLTDGATVLAYGPSSVTWFNNIGATQVRLYTETTLCDVVNVSRNRTVVCNGSPTAVFTPNTGLYTDAAGTIPYDGITAVTGVYALPTATQTYTAVSNNGFNCPSAPTSVTVTVGPCETIVNLKLFIEGYYQGGSTMRSVKNNQDGISPTDEVEDLVVELHDSATYATVATATSSTLKTDGTAVCTFGPVSGSYYIVVKGDNVIQTWSANPQLVGASPLTYDFSADASSAYGDNQLEIETGIFVFYSGDINQDEAIDNTDGVDLTNDIENSEFGVKITDLNGDGAVDNSDAPFFDNNATNSIFSNHP